MTHHIRRQILELDLDRSQAAETLQRRASSALQERVLPELDRLFSQIAPEGRVVRLDRLEVDLGDLDDRNWEQRFVERCVQYVAQKVSEAAFSVDDLVDGGPRVLDARENAWEVLVFFLEHGVLPWFARDMSLAEIARALSPDVTAAEASPALIRLLREKPVARQRLIRQFDPTLVEPIFEKIFNLSPGWIQHAVQIRQSQTGRPVSPGERILLLENLLSVLQTTTYTVLPEPALVARLFYLTDEDQPVIRNQQAEAGSDVLRNSPRPAGSESGENGTPASPSPEEKSDSSRMNAAAEEEPLAPSVRPNTRQQAEEEGGPQSLLSLPGDQPKQTKTYGGGDENLQAPDAKPDGGQKKEDNKPLSHRKPSRIFVEGIWVGDAGLVLLAPYFPAFFQKVGIDLTPESASWYLENEAIADTSILKALQILHFLATGEENPEEHQLALPKILCGFPVEALIIPNDTVPVEETESDKTAGSGAPILSASDITEALNLLQAVIQNWPVLKNTTTEGLQNGFLNRSGLLRWEENRLSWVLRVERQSFDILLDRLPWGYSVIKLPWMQQMVQVEW